MQLNNRLTVGAPMKISPWHLIRTVADVSVKVDDNFHNVEPPTVSDVTIEVEESHGQRVTSKVTIPRDHLRTLSDLLDHLDKTLPPSLSAEQTVAPEEV